jgi:hypothetical protein
MKQGCLSEYFTGVAVKTLSAVEADPVRSNQHEFNGVDGLRQIFGQATGKRKIPARFVYLSDDVEESVAEDGFLTWYDARERHPTRSEHRLYFPSTVVSNRAQAGDLLVIGVKQDGSALVIVADGGSTVENQILWLFGVGSITTPGFAVRTEDEGDRVRLEYASRLILDSIGVEPLETDDAVRLLDGVLARFGPVFPSTRDFSAYARGTLGLDPADDPDGVLVAWMDREETLFRALERHLISMRLAAGFADDVDGFIAYSLSVQNRRKSRVGAALENHLEEIFLRYGIRYDRTKVTENRARPDFLFPGVAEYRDPVFPDACLTVLGVKTTCKDRWRQVLAEADRIHDKHLFTLEPGISRSQTEEMRAKHLALVLPRGIHVSYHEEQRSWLMALETFVSLVRERQKRSV